MSIGLSTIACISFEVSVEGESPVCHIEVNRVFCDPIVLECSVRELSRHARLSEWQGFRYPRQYRFFKGTGYLL